jgi:hypothetical protein
VDTANSPRRIDRVQIARAFRFRGAAGRGSRMIPPGMPTVSSASTSARLQSGNTHHPKVEQFERSVALKNHVVRLNVAMDDAGLV